MFKTKIGRLSGFAIAIFMALAVLTPVSTASAEVNVYTTPGYHNSGGLNWFTKCEPYSQTTRCTSYTWGIEFGFNKNGGLTGAKTKWRFNNLTYLPSKRSLWKGNPLGNSGSWTDNAGRKWRTECDTANTGRGGCRTYVWGNSVVTHKLWGPMQKPAWVFNNMVFFYF